LPCDLVAVSLFGYGFPVNCDLVSAWRLFEVALDIPLGKDAGWRFDVRSALPLLFPESLASAEATALLFELGDEARRCPGCVRVSRVALRVTSAVDLPPSVSAFLELSLVVSLLRLPTCGLVPTTFFESGNGLEATPLEGLRSVRRGGVPTSFTPPPEFLPPTGERPT